MTNPSLLILAGDGIGPEVMAEVKKIIGWMGAKRGVQFDVSEDLVGGCAYDKHGTPLHDATMAKAQAAEVINADDLHTISGTSSLSAGSLVIQAGQQARITANNIVIDAGSSLTLTAGGHHIVIDASGIFSSVPIVQGGAPLAGIAPLQALQASPGQSMADIASPASIVASARQQAVDYCPLCEACRAGQCSIGEVA